MGNPLTSEATNPKFLPLFSVKLRVLRDSVLKLFLPFSAILNGNTKSNDPSLEASGACRTSKAPLDKYGQQAR